jgi:hypothetical protein
MKIVDVLYPLVRAIIELAPPYCPVLDIEIEIQ